MSGVRADACQPHDATALSWRQFFASVNLQGGQHDIVTLAAAAAGTLLIALLDPVCRRRFRLGTAVAPPPELKEVAVDPATTALFLDIMKAGCTARPRCVAAVPNMKRLHDAARAKNMVVWRLVGSNGKATPDDIMDPALAARRRMNRQGGPDKFLGSTLRRLGRRDQDRDRLRQLVQGRPSGRLRARRSAASSHRSGRLLGG
jgi:hypothetical protein